MIGYLGIIAIQVACIVHLVKTGRNTLWLTALIFLPLVGSIAYFIVEILPGLSGNRHIRAAQARAVATLDPERELRAARDALDLADTVANQVRVGDALGELGRWSEAEAMYRAASQRTPSDIALEVKLARAALSQGHASEALAILERLPDPFGQSEKDRRALIRARALDHVGRKDEALAVYGDIADRLPGDEARCRNAGLLLEQGWNNKARKVLEEIEDRAKRLTRQQRAAEADMYAWAADTLREMRQRG